MKKDRFGSASFRLKAGLRTFRFWRWLIRFIGVIVPQRFRARFRQEWEAELEYRETLLARWDRLDWRNKLELLRRSLGAFWDALLLQPIRLEDEMFQDLRYGARMMLKSKMLTMVAVLSLALGIGANTAIFSLINALMLRMLPVKNAEELALFSVAGPQAPEGASYNCNYPLYEMFRDRNQTLTGVITGANVGRARLLVNEPRAVAESVQQQRVSGNFFSVLGVNAVVGRALTEADDNQANGQPGAVISYEYWRRRFGLDPQVVGRQVTVNNTALTIVGVAPPGFFGFVVGSKPELWWPIKAVSDQGLQLDSRDWAAASGREHVAGASGDGDDLSAANQRRGRGAISRLDADAAAEPLRAPHQVGIRGGGLYDIAAPVPPTAVHSDGGGRADSADRLCQRRQSSAGARGDTAQRDCRAAGARRGTLPVATPVADRERPAVAARRRGGLALRARVSARADHLSASADASGAGCAARCAGARVYSGRLRPDRLAIRPRAGVAGDAFESDGFVERSNRRKREPLPAGPQQNAGRHASGALALPAHRRGAIRAQPAQFALARHRIRLREYRAVLNRSRQRL